MYLLFNVLLFFIDNSDPLFRTQRLFCSSPPLSRFFVDAELRITSYEMMRKILEFVEVKIGFTSEQVVLLYFFTQLAPPSLFLSRPFQPKVYHRFT